MVNKRGFPEDYPDDSPQRALYKWGRGRPNINMGRNDESGADFIARLSREHPDEVPVFLAKWRLGV